LRFWGLEGGRSEPGSLHGSQPYSNLTLELGLLESQPEV